jgi:hypothetical protein
MTRYAFYGVMVDMNTNRGVSFAQVLKKPLSAEMSPRQSVAFFTPVGFASMGGSAANKTPACREYARRLTTVLSFRPPSSQKRGLSVSVRSKPMAHAKNPSVENCRSLFGEHPEDVIAPLGYAGEALGWLEELFKTIATDALAERNSYRIKQLADLGAYVASESSNFASCQHESMCEKLAAAGIQLSKEPSHA